MDVTTGVKLAKLTKDVVDIIKSIWELVDRRQNVDQQRLVTQTKILKTRFEYLQNRINDLSLGISQVEDITRRLPLWIEKINELENKILVQNFNDQFVLNLYSDFESFLRHSNSDYVSAIFYKESFDALPSVNEKIGRIRGYLDSLRDAIHAIPSRDSESWQIHLPVIKLRLNDLKKEGSKLDYHCIDLRVKFINELKEVATIKFDF